ncbi:MAG: DUF6159 family protein [Steroidobacteraceae bacterium]
MSGRFSRSVQLAKASFAVVRADKELMLLPVMSVFALIVIVASLAVPVAVLGGFSTAGAQSEPLAMTGALVFYVVTYFVAIFFNAALVGAAMIRMDGGNPTLGDGLRIAWARKGRILGYALIAATMGLILRAIEERVGWLGALVVKLIGAAWAVATFLVVPVLVTRDVGPIGAVKESAELLRETWGENLIGNFGLGLVFMLVYLVWIAVGVVALAFASKTGYVALIGAVVLVGVVGLLAISALQATMQGVYAAALYRHATQPAAPVPGFPPDLMANAFRAKG